MFKNSQKPSFSLQVYFSKDYEKFNVYDRNRTISELFIQKLVADESFQHKYIYNPIIVSPNLCIIDGQHRFKACEKLGLPIAFVIDPTANEEDIKNLNMNQNCWKGNNFLDFYSHVNEDYKLLKDLKERHQVNLSLITSALRKICNFRNMEFHYQFKRGEVKIGKNKEKFVGFIESYVPSIKRAREIKGYESTRTFYQDSTVIGFAHYYLVGMKTYEKAINKLSSSSYPFPFCGSYEQARICVEKLANYAEKS